MKKYVILFVIKGKIKILPLCRKIWLAGKAP